MTVQEMRVLLAHRAERLAKEAQARSTDWRAFRAKMASRELRTLDSLERLAKAEIRRRKAVK